MYRALEYRIDLELVRDGCWKRRVSFYLDHLSCDDAQLSSIMSKRLIENKLIYPAFLAIGFDEPTIRWLVFLAFQAL
jgi:hypothetical protein